MSCAWLAAASAQIRFSFDVLLAHVPQLRLWLVQPSPNLDRKVHHKKIKMI